MEPVCFKWEHEEVNAGFLKLVSEVANEPIVYYGAEEHLQCVSSLFSDSRVTFKKFWGNQEIRGHKVSKWQYVIFFLQILLYEHPRIIFVMTAFYKGIEAAEIISRLYPFCKIYIVLHSVIEPKSPDYKLYKRSIQSAKYYSNISFLTYSPYCSGSLWNIPSEKMIFLHHPYIEKVVQRDNAIIPDKIVVGIIGACANDNTYRMLSALNRIQIKEKYEFWILSSNSNMFKGFSFVQRINSSFSRKELETILQKTHYLFFPYGTNEYTISASGVFWDAVSNKVPCLFYNNKYISYYQKYNIGFQTNNLKELLQLLKELPFMEPRNNFFIEMERLETERQVCMNSLIHIER